MAIAAYTLLGSSTFFTVFTMTKLQKRLGEDFIDFAEHTSAHGIPRAYVSNGFRRFLWLLLFLFCLGAFGYQAYLIVLRFLRNDIIVGVEINYKNIAFPSVTVCNLNPYKTSKALEQGNVKETLQSLQKAMAKNALSSTRSRRHLLSSTTGAEDVTEARIARVYCSMKDTVWQPDYDGREKCICAANHVSKVFWNCAPVFDWVSSTCSAAQIGLSPSTLSHPNALYLCHCNGEFCLRDEDLADIQGKWPIVLSTSNCAGNQTEKCLCAMPKTSGSAPSEPTIAYCSPWNRWHLSQCNMCNWWGRCMRAYGLLGEKECICDGESVDKCFVVESTDSEERIEKAEEESEEETKSLRVRRHNKQLYEKILSSYEGLLAVYTSCECEGEENCKALKTKDPTKDSCLCFFDKKNDVVWPCYHPKKWAERKCSGCTTFGNCNFSDKPSAKQDCLCAMPIKMCVKIEPAVDNITAIEERVVPFWEIQPTTTMSPVQKKKEETEKAYNYVAKDPVALNEQAKENIIFAIDKLSPLEKQGMSYTKAEFITRCSFNSRECNITNDFSTHLDPIYGTCFTFNHDPITTGNLTSERAGPNYGLRFQVFVNIDEYMPTTEAAGVRLTVHSSAEQPFPDTLGYSAPTGFVSSFGIRMKHITRLPSPYGDCVQDGKDENFIYTDKEYSTEGCQRSCVQQHLVSQCGCGDPRYPMWRNVTSCAVDNPDKRECLKRETEYSAKHIDKLKCKKCRQPCRQQVFSISYSASRWPATPADKGDCPKGLNPQQCLNYLREQGAMIEVFFEQLNYESLQESEAYGLPNLLSDFGGQLGLWMGVSVITISEVGILVFDIFLSFLGYGKKERKPSRRSINSSIRYSFHGNQTKPYSPTTKNPVPMQQPICLRGYDLKDCAS